MLNSRVPKGQIKHGKVKIRTVIGDGRNRKNKLIKLRTLGHCSYCWRYIKQYGSKGLGSTLQQEFCNHVK